MIKTKLPCKACDGIGSVWSGWFVNEYSERVEKRTSCEECGGLGGSYADHAVLNFGAGEWIISSGSLHGRPAIYFTPSGIYAPERVGEIAPTGLVDLTHIQEGEVIMTFESEQARDAVLRGFQP